MGMCRKSVHYILTFHVPQIMWELGGMTPLYFYKSFFFFGALFSFNI